METNKCTCERPDDNTCEYCEQQSSIQILKEPTMITDWLNEHGDPEITKKVEKEAELREAAENFYREFPSNPLDKPEWNYNRDVDCFKKRKAFINGAKWQAERMYSEEDLREAIKKARDISDGKDCFDAEDISGCTEVCTYGWKFNMSEDLIIEQFKKK